VSSDYSPIVTEVTRQVTAAFNSRISSLEADNKALKSRISSLEADNEALKADNEALNSRISSLVADNEATNLDLQREKRERKDDLEALRKVLCFSHHYLPSITIHN
jgi:regulator of replication initiation timing